MNAKQSAQAKAEDSQVKIARIGKALFELGCVKRNGETYSVTMATFKGREPRVFTVTGDDCGCGGQADCEHFYAVQNFIAQNEIEDGYNNFEYYEPTDLERVANDVFLKICEEKDAGKEAEYKRDLARIEKQIELIKLSDIRKATELKAARIPARANETNPDYVFMMGL